MSESPIDSQILFQMKELELNALFETIRAINSNSSEEDLFKIYRFILRSNPGIDKLALFVFDEDQEWVCRAHFGTKNDFSKTPITDEIHKLASGDSLVGIEFFDEFDKVLPIKHKNENLAYCFIGISDKPGAAAKLDLNFIQALGDIILVAVENKKLARKEKKQEALKRQVDIARDVQNLLFPKRLPQNHHLTVVASYKPHHTVGGDYYDYVKINSHKFLMCVADVSGKGVPAAILMSNFQAAVRILVRQTDNLKTIIEELNNLIYENGNGDNFITAFFVTYDFKTKSLSYINCGHNPPILFKNKEDIQFLKDGSTVLGVFNPLPFQNIATINGLDDFLLFCFTDGFTETNNDSGEEFGEANLQKFIMERYLLPQKELHKQLLAYLNQYRGSASITDDITLLSCRVKNSRQERPGPA